ncbi:chloride channel protein [Foetidibacter luteolus]|uniref:chloride channel protein n=1 Tax=Foetidibacter luteolus TaxID=2608880 RepID=UPI00129B7851|nr:chloride channel protein [Foetidibacter luteolus]
MRYFSRLRLLLKQRFDLIHNERMKLGLLQAFPFWIASLLTGLVAVLYAKMFAWAEELSAAIFGWHHWLIFIQAPIFIFIGWWLVKLFAPASRGSGIPQVMAAIDIVDKNPKSDVTSLLSLKVAATKIASSLSMVLGGAAVGREGPTIQIAGSVFKFVYALIPAGWPKVAKPNMIVAGAAAGLAAAFNTPLGGIVFAVEELSRSHISFYRTALFSAVIIAGLTAQAMLGPYMYLGYPQVDGLSWYILFIVVIVAILGGIAGSYMCQLIIKVLRWKARTLTSTRQNLFFSVGCSLLLASGAFFVSHAIVGSGKEIMQQLLFTDVKTNEWYVFPLRFIGPLLSFTTGGAGGVFAPGLTAGACIGASVADWFNLHATDANLLILAGMVSFLTGITRTPFTSAILVLEMTDRHSVIFHLMVAGLIAGLASLLVDKKSFYDHLKHDYLKEFKNSAPHG